MIDLEIASSQPRSRKPDWLRVKLPIGEEYRKVRQLVDTYKLHTICQSGNCPNMGECWGAGTATFMILGNVCTRSCSFCAVKTGRPTEYDEDEPRRVAEAVSLMKVKHAVITSVNRDELNRILDKVSKSGLSSLSPDELRFLMSFVPPDDRPPLVS